MDTGRRYSTSRRVRLGDVTPSGRLRLDALARYLQDVAFDDGEDAGLTSHPAPEGKRSTERWILRRLAIDVTSLPRFTDVIDLTTWCSGAGGRWAERRTSITGARATIEAAAIWVFVDERGRPARLPPEFFEHWGTSAGDRKVSARLSHPDPPAGAPTRPWPLRATDFDVIGHVNNAAYWEAAEELLLVGPGRWEIEFRDEVPRTTTDVELVVDGTSLWWTTGGRVHASVRALLPG